MTEYAFDIEMRAAIRVKADSEKEARKMLRESLNCADANFGAWDNGDPITGEASMFGRASLYEVDGKEV